MSICKIAKWKIQKCPTQVAPAGEKAFQGGDFLKAAIEEENWEKVESEVQVNGRSYGLFEKSETWPMNY